MNKSVHLEIQIVKIIEYLEVAVLKPFKLYRLYALISFVHEAEENPQVIKKRYRLMRIECLSICRRLAVGL